LSNKVHVKKGDTVVLLTGEGKEAGKKGKVLEVNTRTELLLLKNEYCKEASKTQITISAGRYN